jgi:GNAT superfamily N-acetyltransferase
MDIVLYQTWMRAQIVELFAMEYGVSVSDFEHTFVAFYEHPFQEGQGVRIVALDGEKVGGFQSFFYWPVSGPFGTARVLQSGNSLVHPEFRGKGLFGKMLDYVEKPGSGVQFDYLIGFPVEMSFGSFMRKKWLNPFDLQWYVRPMRPVRALLSNPEKGLRRAFGERTPLDAAVTPGCYAIEQSAAFDTYRFGFQKDPLFRYTYRSGNNWALFELKLQRRKRVLTELVIGKIASSTSDKDWMEQALQGLINVVNRHTSVSMVSIAINPLAPSLNEAVQQAGFRKINRSIHFIAKGTKLEQMDWSRWWVFRGDIDTW